MNTRKRALSYILVGAVCVVGGWFLRGGYSYPEKIHVTMPAREPGKFAERHALVVTSSSRDGQAVAVTSSNPDVPSEQVWKIRLEWPGAAPMVLFCEPLR